IGARTFPLENGKARLDMLAKLPAVVSGTGILVVSGISGKKTDAPFTVKAGVPMADAGADGSAKPPPMMTGGCSCNAAGPPGGEGSIVLLLLAVLRRRK